MGFISAGAIASYNMCVPNRRYNDPVSIKGSCTIVLNERVGCYLCTTSFFSEPSYKCIVFTNRCGENSIIEET